MHDKNRNSARLTHRKIGLTNKSHHIDTVAQRLQFAYHGKLCFRSSQRTAHFVGKLKSLQIMLSKKSKVDICINK